MANRQPADNETRTSKTKTDNSKNKHRQNTFHFTSEGFVLLLVMILVGFAAWHSGTNLLYMLFACLFALFIIHGNLLWINFRKLSINRNVPHITTAESPTPIEVTMNNGKKLFDSFGILVQTDDGESPHNVFFPHIKSKSSARKFYEIIFPHRGRYQLSGVRLTSRYPFLFEERSYYKKDEKEILVLPPVYSISHKLLTNLPAGFGDRESQVRGSGTELYGIRQYSPGEHIRHIHWKSTARSQKMMVMEHLKDERQQIVIILNNIAGNHNSSATSEDFEMAVLITTALINYYLNNEFEITLITANNSFSTNNDNTSLSDIQSHLAVVKLSPSGSLQINETTRKNSIFITCPDSANPVGAFTNTIESSQWKRENGEIVPV